MKKGPKRHYDYVGRVVKKEGERIMLEVVFDNEKVLLNDGDNFVTFSTVVPMEEYLL